MKETINDYTVIDLIGKGAFANVYLVEGAKNKRYALKMIAIN